VKTTWRSSDVSSWNFEANFMNDATFVHKLREMISTYRYTVSPFRLHALF